MSPEAITLITYLWHYLLARTVFDQLLRPLEHGDCGPLVLWVGTAGAGVLVGRWTRRRR